MKSEAPGGASKSGSGSNFDDDMDHLFEPEVEDPDLLDDMDALGGHLITLSASCKQCGMQFEGVSCHNADAMDSINRGSVDLDVCSPCETVRACLQTLNEYDSEGVLQQLDVHMRARSFFLSSTKARTEVHQSRQNCGRP